MSICERCGKQFIPVYPEMDELCWECVMELISEHEKTCPNEESESSALLEGIIKDMREGSEVEQLLNAPGVPLTIAKMLTVSEQTKDTFYLAQNCFRLGAWMAFNRSKLQKLVEG